MSAASNFKKIEFSSQTLFLNNHRKQPLLMRSVERARYEPFQGLEANSADKLNCYGKVLGPKYRTIWIGV
ncbi:unnamed protein product [Dovyalis caffra]|uniref:Uncharacterized protein n=1 Tax=Dovyalis caffra TaxID=77055 RepID=A0AAV1SXK6_9ROSI|nr:unnamed protein product [Dovyalis caffra]